MMCIITLLIKYILKLFLNRSLIEKYYNEKELSTHNSDNHEFIVNLNISF